MQQKKVLTQGQELTDSSVSIGTLSTKSSFDIKYQNNHQQENKSNRRRRTKSFLQQEDLEIIEDEEDNNLILRVSPVQQILSHEKKLQYRSLAFLRKYAPQVKKNLMINALNHQFRAQGHDAIFQQDVGNQADEVYRQEQDSLLKIEPMGTEEYDSKEYLIPDVPVLQLSDNILLIEYFSQNIQLLGWLERLKHHLLKEWQEEEIVTPCFIKELQQTEQFSTIQYPQFCWHKSKRMLPLMMIEEQAERLLESPAYNSIQDRGYIKEALELIKVQKGINKLRQIKGSQKESLKKSKLQKDNSKSENVSSESALCVCRIGARNGTSLSLKQKIEQSSSQSSNTQKNLDKDQQERKHEKVLICSYCNACFHIQCMLSDKRWNGLNLPPPQKTQELAVQQVGNPEKKKRGRKRKIPLVPIEDLKESIFRSSNEEIKQGDQQQPLKPALKSKEGAMIVPEAIDVYQKHTLNNKISQQEFLKKIGYTGRQDKWACKNCLFNFVIDNLSSGGDIEYLREIEKTQFVLTQMNQE